MNSTALGYAALDQVVEDTSLNGIREQADRTLGRLREVAGRLGAIGDGIFGSRPEPTSGVAPNSPSLISVMREIEREISAIESALNRF